MLKQIFHRIRSFFILLIRPTLFFLGLVILLIGTPYLICPVYRFPEMKPFTGSEWYNPYESRESGWFKANFHCHTKSWWGITSGKTTIPEIYDHYRGLGYDLIGLSNYQHISPPGLDTIHTISAYEHGYSVWKRHHIVIGASRVDWFDFLLWQSAHQKQFILNRLKGSGFIAIAHPKFLNGFTTEDMALLTGYDAIEVFNSYRDSPDHWDAALSAGNPVWLLGSDDSHVLANTRQTASRWNMINAASTEPDDILDALKTGRYYAAMGLDGYMDNRLISAEIVQNSYHIRFESTLTELTFIGMHGDTLALFQDTEQAQLMIPPDQPYIQNKW